jgi:hypothetical protein
LAAKQRAGAVEWLPPVANGTVTAAPPGSSFPTRQLVKTFHGTKQPSQRLLQIRFMPLQARMKQK